MRFKLFFEEAKKAIRINVLKDSSQDVILPENPEQHVYYPIPNTLLNEVDTTIQGILEEEDLQDFAQLEADIKTLIKKRTDTMMKLRKKYNIKIMDFCKSYRDNFPEWFI